MSARSRNLWSTEVYNDHGCKLDIWMSGTPVNAPTLMWIPGGAWIWGDRRFQGYALMEYLVERGWICAAIEYRTGIHRWPTQMNDVRDAWHWCDEHLADFGGGEFMAVAGASAGAHMAALLGSGRSADRPDATIGLYGAYSWDSRRLDHRLITEYVEKAIVGERRGSTTYRNSSPIHRAHENVAPFLGVHGDRDVLTPFSGAKAYVEKLKRVSSNSARLHKVPGAGHGFDLFGGAKTDEMCRVVYDFLTDRWVDFEWDRAS